MKTNLEPKPNCGHLCRYPILFYCCRLILAPWWTQCPCSPEMVTLQMIMISLAHIHSTSRWSQIAELTGEYSCSLTINTATRGRRPRCITAWSTSALHPDIMHELKKKAQFLTTTTVRPPFIPDNMLESMCTCGQRWTNWLTRPSKPSISGGIVDY